MTHDQAQQLIEKVKREEPRIVATAEPNRRDNRGNGWRVKLELETAKRVMYINDAKDWESVKQVWSLWLPGLYEEPDTYCLIDNVAMRVTQSKQGYWYADYQQSGIRLRRYFGRNDPREKYPIVEKTQKAS